MPIHRSLVTALARGSAEQAARNAPMTIEVTAARPVVGDVLRIQAGRTTLGSPKALMKAAHEAIALGNKASHPAYTGHYDTAAACYREALAQTKDARTMLKIATDAIQRGRHGALTAYNGYPNNQIRAAGLAGFDQALASATTKQEAHLIREQARVLDHQSWRSDFQEFGRRAFVHGKTLPDETSSWTRFTTGVKMFFLLRK